MMSEPTSSGAPPPASKSRDIDFYFEEWKSLRAGIAAINQRLSNLEYASVIAISAYYAWVIQYIEKTSLSLVNLILLASIPVCSTVVVAIRCYVLQVSIDHSSAYIQRIERYILSNNSGGWESYFQVTHSRTWFSQRMAFWTFVLAGQIIASTVLLSGTHDFVWQPAAQQQGTSP